MSKLISRLKQNPSILTKLAILKVQDTTLNRMLLIFTYDKRYVYGMRKLPIDGDIGEPTNEMFDLVRKIIQKAITGNEAKETVLNFDDPSGQLIRLVCNKNLDCGISIKTINKAFDCILIEDFAVQLAKEVPINSVYYPVIGQIKYDGVRIIAMKKQSDICLRTRNGKYISFPKLEQALADLKEDIVLDGELVVNSGKQKDRVNISGIVNSAIHGNPISNSLASANRICFKVFDCLLPSEFKDKKCLSISAERSAKLARLLLTIDQAIVQKSESIILRNYKELQNYYSTILSLGYEGLILKVPGHYYSFKRSKDWIKLKTSKDVDLVCTDAIPGQGKYSGKIGSLVCSGTIGEKKIYACVGSGLTDEDRDKAASSFLAKIITVKYNCIIRDKTSGTYSLFLPRFVCIRLDKSD